MIPVREQPLASLPGVKWRVDDGADALLRELERLYRSEVNPETTHRCSCLKKAGAWVVWMGWLDAEMCVSRRIILTRSVAVYGSMARPFFGVRTSAASPGFVRGPRHCIHLRLGGVRHTSADPPHPNT